MSDPSIEAKRKASVERLLRLVAEEDEAAEASNTDIVESIDDRFKDAAPEAHDEDDTFGKAKEQQQNEEDAALAKLNIVTVYRKLTGNPAPKNSGGSGEKRIFCPTSDHSNTNTEAACVNIKKNTWVCYGQCDNGGGVIDMVAAANGMPFGKHLKGKDYAQAKQKTLEDFCGWTFDKTPAGWEGKSPAKQKAEVEEFEATYGKLPEEANDEAEPEQEPAKPSQPSPPRVEAVERPTLVPDPKEDEDSDDGIDVDLPRISSPLDHVPSGTALYEYLDAVRDTRTPDEFDLFRGLQLLALSGGPFLRGNGEDLFKPTLSVLFIGRTGSGKSRSKRAFDEVLRHPCYKWMPSAPAVAGSPGTAYGVRQIQQPGSGEYLIQQLAEETINGVKFTVQDVMGFVEIDEFSHFAGKASMSGSTLTSTIQGLDNNSSLYATQGGGSKSGGTIVATNGNLVLGTGTQFDALPGLLGKSNLGNGLLARFELVTGNWIPPRGLDAHRLRDLTDATELYVEITNKYQKLRLDNNGKETRKLTVVGVEYSAYGLMDERYIHFEMLSQGDPAKSRHGLKFQKLCLLFAINSGRDVIVAEDIENASWVMEYLDRTANITGGKVVSNDFIEAEQSVKHAALALTRKEGYFVESQLRNRCRADKKGWSEDFIHKIVMQAVDRHDMIEVPGVARAGKKTPRYAAVAGLSGANLKNINKPSEQAKGRKSK